MKLPACACVTKSLRQTNGLSVLGRVGGALFSYRWPEGLPGLSTLSAMLTVALKTGHDALSLALSQPSLLILCLPQSLCTPPFLPNFSAKIAAAFALLYLCPF